MKSPLQDQMKGNNPVFPPSLSLLSHPMEDPVSEISQKRRESFSGAECGRGAAAQVELYGHDFRRLLNMQLDRERILMGQFEFGS